MRGAPASAGGLVTAAQAQARRSWAAPLAGGWRSACTSSGSRASFDAAYGSSAGALNAMWLVSGRLPQGIPTWTDPALVGALIRPRRAAARRPGRGRRDARRAPLRAALPRPVRRGPRERDRAAPDRHRRAHGRRRRPARRDRRPADAAPGAARVRRAAAAGRAARRARRPPARRRRPVGGDPVPRRARRRAHHVLVLRSRRAGEAAQPPARVAGALTARLLRRIAPAVAQAFRTRRRARGRGRGAARPPRRRPGAGAARPVDPPGARLAGARRGWSATSRRSAPGLEAGRAAVRARLQ